MRILTVRLSNLNSLAGTWSIDLTEPEYTGSGIFAITGPTGSGKSTILDAICLALYGRTPRLGRITKSSNEIMSRRTGACFAEVEFETNAQRFRCHWSQHRARKRPGGELQQPKHEIVDSGTGRVLESKLNEVRLLVERFTGMDFERFTRSILLAQGGFAAFLQASGDQRAPILEQITGTEIYSRISVKVHERRNVERDQLELLREKIGTVQPMGAEEEQTVRQRLEKNREGAVELQQGLEQVRQAIGWLDNLERLQRDQEQLIRDTEELQARREEVAPDLVKLAQGMAATALEGDYRRLQEMRSRQRQAVARQAQLGREAEQLAAELTRQGSALDAAEHKADKVKERYAAELAVGKRVRDLDIRIGERDKERNAYAADLAEASAAVDRTRKQRDHLAGKLAEIGRSVQANTEYLMKNQHDAILVGQLVGIRHRVEALTEGNQELQEVIQQRKSSREILLDLDRATASHGQRHEQLTEETGRLQTIVNQLAGELKQLLAGRQPGQLRQDVRQAEQRLRGLQTLQVLREEEQRLTGLQRQAITGLEQLEHKTMQLKVEGERLDHQRDMQSRLLEQLELTQRFSLQVRDYAEGRRHLVPGKPCPLCGSVDHPWALDLPVPEDVDAELRKGKEAYEQLVAGRARNREQLAGFAREHERLSRELDRRNEQLTEICEELARLLAEQQAEGRTIRLVDVDREVVAAEERVQAAQAQTTRLEALEPQQDTFRNELELKLREQNTAELNLGEARLKAQSAAQEVHRYNQAVGEQVALYCQRRRELLHQLRPLGIAECRPREMEKMLGDLDRRRQQWQEAIDRDRALQEEQRALQAVLAGETTLVERRHQELMSREAQLARRDEQLSQLRKERCHQYGDKDPDREEQRLRSKVETAEERCRQVRVALNDLERRLHGVRVQSRELQAEIKQLGTSLPGEESAFTERVRQAGFVDLGAFTGALLPEEQLFRLTALKEGLDKEDTVLASRKEENKSALDLEQKKQVTGKTAAVLQEEQMAVATQLEGLQQQIGADNEKLQHNDRLKLQQQKQLAELNARQRELARWNTLHELIGSADGKKFRVFAQGLTFALMIDHANLQLRKMNDRYILVRDPSQPLELQVIDSYQAGETRSTRNLSGGESFIVSLALSLGLSAMASRKVRVDSFFLDEGFGTLDEEALNTALQTLSQLQQDGKLIGVISHVPMLKDRILTRIQVKPGANGCSRLIGPGCMEEPG